MNFYRLNKKKRNKIAALSSAFILTVSNSFPTAFAKDNLNSDIIGTGGVANPYIPSNAKLDEHNNPILDEDGDYILLDEEGKVIPKDRINSYLIKPNSKGEIIYKLIDYTTSKNVRATNRVINVYERNVNIRSSADANASIVGKLPPDGVATILQESGTWIKISYNNITGWVTRERVTIIDESPNSVLINFTDSNVNIRSTNSSNGTVLAKIPPGGTTIAVNANNGWFKVLYNNVVGWVSDDYVKFKNVSASQYTFVSSSGTNESTYIQDKTTGTKNLTSNAITDSSGRHVFCLDPEKVMPNKHPYYRSTTADDITYKILKYGYPNASITGDAVTDRIITQIALWGHVDPSRVNLYNSVAYKNGVADSAMLSHIYNLYAKAKSGKETQVVSTNFSSTNLTAKLSGDHFVTDYITIWGYGDMTAATTKLKFFDTATGVQRTDIQAVLENGQSVSTVNIGQKFRLLIPKSSSNGSIKIVGNSTIKHRVAVKYSTNMIGIQDIVTLETIEENKASANNVIVTWNSPGSLNITKVDADSKAKLKDAVFTVTNSAGNKVATITTDSYGAASIPSLPYGTYKVQETKAPYGYELDSTVHTVQVNSSNPINLTLSNKKILGSIQVTKVDSHDSSKTLQGAEFTLYDYQDKPLQKATTNSSGVATFKNLVLGSYTIRETKAPEGYVLDSQATKTEIKTQGQSLKFTFKNAKEAIGMGELDFSKTDVSTGDIIEGATIEIKGLSDTNKHVKMSFVSSKNGNRFALPVGKYEFKETIAPQGYILSSEVGTFEIKANGEVVKANLKNTPITGNVKITKVDADNKDLKLEGAEFTLYDKNNNEISKATTDTNGIANFTKLPYGEYLIKETKSPDGYILTENTISVKIAENNKTLTYTVTNSKSIGEVDFSKTDVSTGDIIEGATIEIKGLDKTNKHVKISFVSSKDGNKFSVPTGKYEFKEIIAPEGYVLSEEVGTFEIKSNGDIVKANLKNTPITGNIKITKVDTENKELKLEGAEFTLLDKDNKEISKATSNKDGVVEFTNIPYGEYLIKETKAPNGYVLTDNSISAKITKHQETLTYTVTNSKSIGEVDFSKTDVSTGDILEGALIDIKGLDETNKDITISFRSSKEGNKFKLPVGKYEFKETQAPDGYILSEEVGTFEIKENGEIVKANLKNTPFTATLQVIKIDHDTKKTLEGAEFTLTDKDGNVVSSGTTNVDGLLFFNNLKIGTYTLTETKAPNGYSLPKETITVEITNQALTVELEVENKAMLVQTGGNFTTSGLIFSGAILLAVAALLTRKELGGNE